jgi:hypothetical protein
MPHIRLFETTENMLTELNGVANNYRSVVLSEAFSQCCIGMLILLRLQTGGT